MTCGDSRIGAVLAVVEEGYYDDIDNPFLAIFYSHLADYIENTIEIYNSITEADIENALYRQDVPRSTGLIHPVSDVGIYEGFKISGDPNDLNINNEKNILVTRWHQGTPYNNYLNAMKVPPEFYHYVTGCGPTAVAQIMAFHGKFAMSNNLPFPHTFDWIEMRKLNPNKDAENAIGVLMYEIGLPENANAKYHLGYLDSSNNPKDKEGAATETSWNGIKNAFIEIGYRHPGTVITYNFERIKKSIYDGYPVIAAGWTDEKHFLWFTWGAGVGHYWIIDGYRQMEYTVKNDISNPAVTILNNFVHCNLGWSNRYVEDINGSYTFNNVRYRLTTANGWYFSGVFDTNVDRIPIPDQRSVEPGHYQYQLEVLIGTTP